MHYFNLFDHYQLIVPAIGYYQTLYPNHHQRFEYIINQDQDLHDSDQSDQNQCDQADCHHVDKLDIHFHCF